MRVVMLEMQIDIHPIQKSQPITLPGADWVMICGGVSKAGDKSGLAGRRACFLRLFVQVPRESLAWPVQLARFSLQKSGILDFAAQAWETDGDEFCLCPLDAVV